ncbi:hypothetical protein ACWKT3_25335 [Streptomyces violaceus]
MPVERDLLDACLVVEPQQLRLLEQLGSHPRPVEQRVHVALAGLRVEADVLNGRERRGQEIAKLVRSLEAELLGERRAEHDTDLEPWTAALGRLPRRRDEPLVAALWQAAQRVLRRA